MLWRSKCVHWLHLLQNLMPALNLLKNLPMNHLLALSILSDTGQRHFYLCHFPTKHYSERIPYLYTNRKEMTLHK